MFSAWLWAYAFDDEGLIIGAQNKLQYSNRFERVMEISLDTKINVFSTKIGKISILISGDGRQFECVKIARNLGADIILCPSCDSTIENSELSNYNYVQNSDLFGVYIVTSMLGGDLGMNFSGSSSIYAPVNVTKNRDGILSKILIDNEAGVTSARLDIAQLRRGLDAYTADRNTEFYKEYLLSSYRKT